MNDELVQTTRAGSTLSSLPCRIKHALSKHCFIMFGKFTGNYLLFSYLLVKLIYLGNAVGQLFLLDVVLGEFRIQGSTTNVCFAEGKN